MVDVDERVRTGERPEDYVRRLAMEKSARAVTVVSGGDIILAADTAVMVDGAILGKPADDLDARRMLELLSGRDHQVLTGISLRSDAVELGSVESTVVSFSPLSRGDIDWYVASGKGGTRRAGTRSRASRRGSSRASGVLFERGGLACPPGCPADD